MNDDPNPLERLARTPLINEIADARRWALSVTNSDELELFLNPQDAEGLEGWRLMNMPILQSIGVPQGKALIFDRYSGQYIRHGEQLHTP
ncbi:hypothetical protein SSOG_09119 [Streptomyces himastatinicus ATCC 53653]|uniref:Uncharacterized protein n=1 Tax=Streptomyces himastatinicus ATCC 53653 TaxID=457427 RepID=D9WWX7_9ACTN|nr:hypothetical protein [Streptomyces himastatinicus]EFL29405.1 hypothetical protein SSOG_09119 [Streptomyces himastatinicus ATCC 53653]